MAPNFGCFKIYDFPQIVNQMKSSQLQTASYLSQANEFIADLNNMQPDYTNFCIKSVQSAVQAKIDAMKIVAAKCRNCTDCAGLGFTTPPFVNNTCPIPQGVGGFLTNTFTQPSSELAILELAWQSYRDDALQKRNYLDMKSYNTIGKISRLLGIFNDYSDKISFDYNQILSKTFSYNSRFASSLRYLLKLISNFNDYFMNQTDYLIILSNQKLKNLLTLNLKNTQCRDRVLTGFFYSLNQFSSDWSLAMSSLLYIADLDAELAAAYSQSSNLYANAQSCLTGDLNLTKACLNQVRENLGLVDFARFLN